VPVAGGSGPVAASPGRAAGEDRTAVFMRRDCPDAVRSSMS
jgi:hypothetical protein